ncbi:TPA: hypothetical protein QIT10_003602 [Enterobacter bugandensis]|nr:hypothetical protein [Enterobacter bugandensis]HEP0376173.1 hypothetical protein [Enterobacter bugandensis]
MSNIDKEWLQQKIAGMEARRDDPWLGRDEDDSNTLAALRIALASLEAEAVAYADPQAFHNFSVYRAGETDNKHMGREWMWANPDAGLIPVYTAPTAPVSVPDEATPENIEILASTYAPRGVTYQWDRDECNAAADSWNACCAAMLQCADKELQRKAAIHDALCEKYNVESLAEFVEWQRNHIAELEAAPPAPVGPGETALMPDYPGYALTQRECYQAGKKAGLAEAGNSPVIPDGDEHGFCQRHQDTRRLTHPYKQLLTYPPRPSTYCPKCDPEVSEWVERDKLLRQNKPDEERPYTVVMPGGCQHEWVHHVPCSRLKPEYEECYKCGVRRPYPAAPQQEA